MKLFFLLLLFLPLSVSAQFNEDWTYLNLNDQLNWEGSIHKFINKTAGQLQLYAEAESSDAFISRVSGAMNNATWQFSTTIDFNPSSSNYVKVFIASNQSTYNNDIEGYYVMIGNTSDEVSLWKLKGGTNTKIIDGVDKVITESYNEISVVVTRDSVGNWTLDATINGNAETQLTVFDDEFLSSTFYGIYCKYTSTRSDKILFGEINVTGEAFVDDVKPFIISNELQNGKVLKLEFDEPIDEASIGFNNFLLPNNNSVISYDINSNTLLLEFESYLEDSDNGSISISGIQDLGNNTMLDTLISYQYNRIKLLRSNVVDKYSLELAFSKPIDVDSLPDLSINNESALIEMQSDTSIIVKFENEFISDKEYRLTLYGIVDEKGDIIKDTTVHFSYHQPQRYELVFNEIMVDPSPSMGLPEEEYIELFNNSSVDYNLKDWYLLVNGKTVQLPEYLLEANTYAIIVDKDGDYAALLNTVLLSTMPSLTNSEGEIILVHKEHFVMDAIKYPFGNFDDSFKDDGGWSLERLDFANYQNYGNNWQYSLSLDGGSPGFENSISQPNPDFIRPSIKNIGCVNDSTFELCFSEVMDTSLLSISSFMGIEPMQVSTDSLFLDRVQFHYQAPLEKNKIHTFEFAELPTDIKGNELEEDYQLRFGAVTKADSLDLIINELLFNPVSTSTDFVEIYNNSDKIIDLNEIRLSKLSEEGIPEELLPLVTNNKIFFPHEHLVICADSSMLKQSFKNVVSERIVESSMPSLPDDDGSIAICNYKGEVLDAFFYSEDMQFALLSNNEGVSLERIDYNSPSNDIHNWHSASSLSGFGTPTQLNSQTISSSAIIDEWIWLTEQEFSPNSDGNVDVLQINYQLNESGWMGSIAVYDKVGRQIKSILSSDLLATSGFVTWDGTDNNYSKSPMGIYIIYAYFYHTDGSVKEEKLVSVLTAGSNNQ